MSNVLHMETEQARAVAQKLHALAESIRMQAQTLSDASYSLDWSGGSRDDYLAELASITVALNKMGDAASLLSQRAKREVDEWEQCAAHLGVGTDQTYIVQEEDRVILASAGFIPPFIPFLPGMKIIDPGMIEWLNYQKFEEQYGTDARKYAEENGVPYQIVIGILYQEKQEREQNIFHQTIQGIGDSWGKLRRDWTVSLGPAQIEVRRAAELEFPGRDFTQEPLTNQEFDDLASKLEDPKQSTQILAKAMQDNYQYYGQKEGKTEADRWCFAIAKHKSGHGPIGDAQVAAQNAGKDQNSWEDVSRFLPKEITEFVNKVHTSPEMPEMPVMVA